MISRKTMFLIVIGISLAVFLGILLHAELITDEKRFLVSKLGNMNSTILGQSFEYPSGLIDIEVHYIEILPGAQSGWHTHDRPLLITILHGTLDVYYCYEDTDYPTYLEECDGNGTIKHFEVGDVFVEAINTKHNGVNNGLIPLKSHIVALNPNQVWDEIYLQPTTNDTSQPQSNDGKVLGPVD